MRVRNPRTGAYDYEFQECSPEKIRQTARKFSANQIAWYRSGVANRIAVVQEWKRVLISMKEELTGALAADTGRTWETTAEVDWVIDSIDKWCIVAKKFYEQHSEWIPYPITTVLSPWNFPLALSMMDTLPALLSGAAVLVKPSEVTPRFVAILEQTIQRAAGLHDVLCITAGTAETGAFLADKADLICFTGSVGSAKKVLHAASKKMIPVLFELGAKDPAVVLSSANLEMAASAIVKGSTTNAGQNCLSFERIYVHSLVYDALVDLLAAKANELQFVDDQMVKGEIGPIIYEKQVLTINSHLEDAFSLGATLVTGSKKCEEINGGYYCRPTVLANVTQNMLVMREETFGPIMPVIPFDQTDELIEMVNASEYALGAAVFAGSDEEALAVAQRINAGSVSINEAALSAILHYGDSVSFNWSGIGGQKIGPENFSRFVKKKNIHLSS